MFLQNPETRAMVLVRETSGDTEERFASYYSKLEKKKPVVAYVAGRTALSGKRVDHAGAIISMDLGDYQSKRRAFGIFSIPVADTLYMLS